MDGFRQDVKHEMEGQGTNYEIAAVIARGMYTILAEADGKGASKWRKI